MPEHNHPPRLETVDLAAVDAADRSFLFAPAAEPPNHKLAASIRRFGLLHPPLLQQRGPDRYIIAAGRKRIMAAIEGPALVSIPALVIGEEATGMEVLTLIMEEWLCGNMPSLVEQIGFLERLLQDHPPETAMPMLAKLGHKPNSHTLRTLLSLRALPPPALLSLHRGRLHAEGARKLLDLPEDIQLILTGIIERFSLGGSKQQKLTGCCLELHKRGTVNLRDLLLPYNDETTDRKQANLPQLAHTLLRVLHELCFPRSTAAEKEFAARVAKLPLPPGAEITHTPAFEDDRLVLSLEFTDWESLEKALARLREADS